MAYVTKINRLFVSGPDGDGDYSIEIGDEYTYLNRAQADELIEALRAREAKSPAATMREHLDTFGGKR